MHRANLAEGRQKSRRRGDAVFAITSVTVSTITWSGLCTAWRSATHDNHTSDTRCSAVTFKNLLLQNHLRPAVIKGNLGFLGGFLLYKSNTFDGIWFQRARLTATTLRLDIRRRLARTSPTLPMANHTVISEKIHLSFCTLAYSHTERAVGCGHQSPERSSSEQWHV